MKHPRFRQSLILLTCVTCVVYLVYRACFTMNVTTPYAVCVSLALFVAELFMGVLMLLFLLQVWRLDEPPEQPILPDRTVDVLVPTYNEDVEILRTTLLACVQMEYPHKTYLCDDGGTDARINDPEKGPAARKRQQSLQALCVEVGAIYRTRPANEHAKAGNMNSVLKQTDGEFVVILDADHVPDRNFITRLIGYFRDDRLAYVQTPHAFYNFDSFQARYDPVRSTYWEEGQLFYDVIQPGRNHWNAAIFAGSAAMFRRQALVEIGGFAVETITEDLHTGLRLHARGWKSLAISQRLVAGQAAPDVTTFHSQRLRWGEGNLSIFAFDNPLTTRGLTLTQRLCYLGSMIHWANGPFLLLIYLTPLFMLFSGVPPVAQFEWIFASLIVLYIGLSTYSFYAVSNGHASFWNSQVYCMTNMWTSTRGMLRAVFLRRFQKFVVTSKRGRQSKSVLAYIWPHAAFFLASILALAWGWYRPISGVSDDFFKPILASVWAVFHSCLALVILRRALWPEDGRFNYRHVVALPAAVTISSSSVADLTKGVADLPALQSSVADPPALQSSVADPPAATSATGGAERHAVTIDLNDTGVGLLAYEPLAVGSRCLVTIRGGGLAVGCLAEVRRCEEMDARLRAGGRGVRAYRCALSFIEPSPAQTDSLNQLCWHYAVPLSYAAFDRRPSGPPPLRLPLLLYQENATEPTWYTVTDDLSPDGLTALLDADLTVGTEVRFRMPTPGEEVCGTARVVEVQTTTLAARTYRQCRFAFAEVEDAGRATLDVLLGGRNARRLRPLLRPQKEPRRVPVLRPAAVGLLLLAVLAPLTFGLFRLNYRDELFLVRVADAPLPLSPEQDNRLQALFRQTISESRYPSNDRLVLLESALLHADKRSEAVQVTRVLAKRDLDNLSLQLAYAQALDDMGEPAAGLREYEKLLKRIEKGDFPAERRISVLLAAARTAVHAGQPELAIPWYRKILANSPDDVAVRNELAGVLLGANQAEEVVVAVFANRPTDWDGLLLLGKANLLARDYAAAEKDARELLARRPRDLDAELLLLDALGLQGNLVAARELGSALIENHPDVPRIRVRAGELALMMERYEIGLLLFQGLLQDGSRLDTREARVQRGFIDAASGVPTVERIDPAVVEQLVRVAAKGWLAQDAGYLGRLAWVCQRLKRYDLTADLLRRVLALEPQSQELRQRYVGVLLDADRGDDALRYLQGLESTPEVRSLLIDVYLHEKNYDAIERIARDDLRINPLNNRARLYLVEVALARNERARARELLAEVRQVPPKSPELRARLANLELWSGDGAAALAEYRSLLEQAPTRKEWRTGYIKAAATAPELTDADAQLIRPIAEQSAKDGEDVLFLSRLAWVLHRLKEPALRERVLDRALALRPTDPESRKELAAVLGAAGRYKEALALYEGLPLDVEERRRLASLYEAAEDFAGAAAQYRLILEKHPGDRAVLERLGLVLSWKKDFRAAAAVYEQLSETDPNNPAWIARVAELKLWSGDAAGALAAYSRLLEKDLRQPKLWHGFVDAAGLVPRLDAAQAKLAQRVGREVLDRPEKDPLFLSRLAWVLVKAGATADAEAVLDQADALHPTDPAVRKELAGVFAAVGRFRRAIELFRGLDLTFADRVRLIQFYNGDNNFEAAEAEARKLLEERPRDREVEMMLADILAWRGKYMEAAALLQRLRQADPDSKELARKQALVDLWGRNYPAALEQFSHLLEGDPNQSALWADFVAAAAAVPALDNRYRKPLMDLADRTLADPPHDTQFLSRLAQSLRTLQEPGKAAALLQQAVDIDPTSRPIKLQLAQTLYDAGRFNEAKRYFRELLPTEDRGP
jgi:cellulose synthase/poly-beta-1,6-N-acetylglucosamine synthase-like glycosyltransferase/predicted Zn-dependent protease